jgi:putative SOS response-associated peptidase YedK
VCGRYTLATPNPAEVRARFRIDESVEVRRRYNVAPGDEVLTVTTDRDGNPRGELLRWGLVPSWAKQPDTGLKMINARVETVAERPAFRRAFERYRCLIVADGFYEWRRLPTGERQAFHITREDGELFAFAGLWSIWYGEQDRHAGAASKLRSCTILTTAANAAVAPLHDRMPVILGRDQERTWMDREAPLEQLNDLLAPLAADALDLRPVGPAVNDARYDGPECLAPPMALSDQPSLF